MCSASVKTITKLLMSIYAKKYFIVLPRPKRSAKGILYIGSYVSSIFKVSRYSSLKAVTHDATSFMRLVAEKS